MIQTNAAKKLADSTETSYQVFQAISMAFNTDDMEVIMQIWAIGNSDEINKVKKICREEWPDEDLYWGCEGKI